VGSSTDQLYSTPVRTAFPDPPSRCDPERIYHTKTPDNVDKLVQVDSVAVAEPGRTSPPRRSPGLPQVRCMHIPGAGGLVPHHWCLAAVGPYTFKLLHANVTPHTGKPQPSTAS